MTGNHEAPLVLPTWVSIVAQGDTGNEPHALRTMLEGLGYHVEVHWSGSRQQMVEILKGNIPTRNHLVLSCHGDDEGGGRILVPEEPDLYASDIRTIIGLKGKTILNLGCATGTRGLAEAFLTAGCASYVAPTGYVDGNSALMFAIHYFYFQTLPNRLSLSEAFARAQAFDPECGMFRLYTAGGSSIKAGSSLSQPVQ